MSATASAFGCDVNFTAQGRNGVVRAELAAVEGETGDMVVDALVPLGAIRIRIEGAAAPLQAIAERCQPIDIGKYRLRVRLDHGVWPYEVCRRLVHGGFGGGEEAPTPACFRDLGLAGVCSREIVEGAFASLVRKAHPDRGGSVEEFVKLRQAYLAALRHLGARR
ncbi:MAG TPA: hypothetical protein VNC50_22755 [Planctomycetia bacterium]|nr:hypothetical protein [Planctomycetia bacterium]